MSWIGKIFKGLFGSSTMNLGSTVNRAMDLISEKIEDPDKRIAAILDLVKAHLHAETNPSWLAALPHWPTLTAGARVAISVLIWSDALHKLGRMALWAWVVWLYVHMAEILQQPLDLETMAMLAAGPTLYTMLKGRGR